MAKVNRVLDREDVADLQQYLDAGGGEALELTRRVGGAKVLEVIEESGLRGRGGAGFPTGLKWSTVASSRSEAERTPVVVNAAEGEPGTFKDRVLLRRNPFRVLEGALVAAAVVGSDTVTIGIKATFTREIDQLVAAIEQVTERGWCEGIDIGFVLGPSSYLFGEETGLLEVIEGRQPFPRVTPPFRRGVDEGDRRSAGGTSMAEEGGSDHAPALVDNVETLANVPLIVTRGADWFRELGTQESPGTIVCTVSGDTRRDGVAEFAMGTPLAEVIEQIGWGTESGHSIGVVVPGTANSLIPGGALDVPTTYEAMTGAGTGLGSAGFIVFDRDTDPADVALGISRFLAVESCGQCQPCKSDGLAIAGALADMKVEGVDTSKVSALRSHLDNVADGARCNLAAQQQEVVGSLLELFPETLQAAAGNADAAAQPVSERAPTEPRARPPLIAPIVDIVGGRAVLDEAQRSKQPDWSFDAVDSGSSPAELLVDTPVEITEPLEARQAAGEAADPTEPLWDPQEVVDRAHEDIHWLLDAASDGSTVATDALVDAVDVHLDAVSRVLYPMAERHGSEDMVALVRRLTERGDLITAMLDVLGGEAAEAPRRRALMRAAGTELSRFYENTRALVRCLGAELDPGELDTLAEGMIEARESAPSQS